MRRTPPHILVTTPESLYLLLTSASGREMLATVRTVIVDEIHAVAQTKRGAHLALTLERLDAHRRAADPAHRPVRDAEAHRGESRRFLLPAPGPRRRLPSIVNSGHIRERDINLVMPAAPLEAVMSGEVWATVYDQLARLIEEHHTTLVFANTRRMVERVSRHLAERLGEENVAAHHGSLSKETRFDAEQRLKAGKLKVMVATASLELGIDIGDVELVCQLGTPRSISVFLQRVGRANHSVGWRAEGPHLSRQPRRAGRLRGAARFRAARRARPAAHSRASARRALAADRGRSVGARIRRRRAVRARAQRLSVPQSSTARISTPWCACSPTASSTKRGRRGTYLHRDAVNHVLRARKGARLTAITCGGAIPDNADYQVILEPAGISRRDSQRRLRHREPARATSSSSAIRRTASCASKRAACASKTRRVSHPAFRSGSAKRRRAPTNFRESVSRLRADIEALLPEVTANRSRVRSTS